MSAAAASPRRLVGRVEALCRRDGDERPLRISLLEELRRSIGFDHSAWLTTDPRTEVGSSPLADVPSLADLPRLIRSRYLTALHRWTTLGATAVGLHAATGGDLARSRVWSEVLAGYGVVDVATLAFRDAFGLWGWLDLWRVGPSTPFGDGELASLAAVVGPITLALRRAQARTFDEATPTPPRVGPAVLLLSPALGVRARTNETEDYLRALVPPGAGRPPVPAGAYNVGAQLLAVEAGVDHHPPLTRAHLGGGTWLTLRAARVDAATGSGPPDIAVTIEVTSPDERRDLFASAHALSARERELVDLLAGGADTREVARRMYVSEHTVQDHLKSIFARTGTRSRRSLMARIVGGTTSGPSVPQ